MKKLIFILLCATIVACNNNTNTKGEAKSNTLLISENWISLAPFYTDSKGECFQKSITICEKDKKIIWETIKRSLLNGKLKAYEAYPDQELSIDKLRNKIDMWDSTHMEENPNKPGEMIAAPLLFRIDENEIAEIGFNEKIELDTVNFILNKKVSFLTFYSVKHEEGTGNYIGKQKLFDVKLNDEPVIKKE